MATIQELESAENELTVQQRVEAFFKGTDALRDFSEEIMVPVLRGQLGLSDRESAIVGIYYRMHLWMRSLVAMNSRIHFQGAAAAARSLFELLMDAELLAADNDGVATARFHAFPQVDRFRVARQVVAYNDQHPESTIDDEHQRSLLQIPNREKEIEEIIVQHWGRTRKGKPCRPEHWSGMSVRSRAEQLGDEVTELYLESYPLLSWAIHSGSAIYAGIGEDAIESSFGISHSLSQRSFLKAIKMTARTMQIDKAYKGLDDVLEELRMTPGRVIVEDQARRIDEAKEQARRELGNIIIP